MTRQVRVNQQGIAHIGLILLLIAVLGAVGFAGWSVLNIDIGDQSAAVSTSTKAAPHPSCEEIDKNICNFMSSWKSQKSYTVVSKTTADGKTTESKYEAEGDNRFHMTATGDTPYEMIVIDNTTYIKAADGAWWKQTAQSDAAPKASDKYDIPNISKDTTSYKRLGNEACGSLTCYKYQIDDSGNPDDKEYVWFDTKNYDLQRTLSETKDGTTNDSAYSYAKIGIKVPSPVKDLEPNQFLMPGASEPRTLPDAGSPQDYQNSLPATLDEQ